MIRVRSKLYMVNGNEDFSRSVGAVVIRTTP